MIPTDHINVVLNILYYTNLHISSSTIIHLMDQLVHVVPKLINTFDGNGMNRTSGNAHVALVFYKHITGLIYITFFHDCRIGYIIGVHRYSKI